MKRLSIAKDFTTKHGEVKTKWYDAGVLLTKQNGKQTVILDLDLNFNNFAKDGKVFLNVTEPQENKEDAPINF